MSESLNAYQHIHRIVRHYGKALYRLRADQCISLIDEAGMSCIHWAMLYQDIEVVEVLLQLGSNVNLQNAQGLTPLHLSLVFKSNILQELKHFNGQKYFAYLGGSPISTDRTGYRNKQWLTQKNTWDVLTEFNHSLRLGIREKFGFNPVTTANLFRSYSTSRTMLALGNATPDVIIEFLYTSVNFVSYSWKIALTQSLSTILALQVKQGLPPRKSRFGGLIEPSSIKDLKTIVDSEFATLYVWDLAVGLPNPIISLSILLDNDKCLKAAEILKYKAILASIEDFLDEGGFGWISINKYSKLTKVLQYIFDHETTPPVSTISPVVIFIAYLLRVADNKLEKIVYGVKKLDLESFLLRLIVLLALIWSKLRMISVEQSLVISLRSVTSMLKELTAKYQFSIYHFVLLRPILTYEEITNTIVFLSENDFDCNVRSKDCDGNSVLQMAFVLNNIHMCGLLLKSGAYPFSINKYNTGFVDYFRKDTKCQRLAWRSSGIKAFQEALDNDEELRVVWEKYTDSPHSLITLAAQAIVQYNIPYQQLTNKKAKAFIELHDPKRSEYHSTPK